MDINIVGKEVIELVRQVGRFISDERKIFSINLVENKGLHDFVSYVDKGSEKRLVEGLMEIIPGSGFITEEETAGHTNEEYIWIIDPLDGTTNFIHNLSPHAISIALKHNSKTILGVVFELCAGEMFYSWQGIPCFCNEAQISVSNAPGLNEALISTGFHINDFKQLQNHLKVVQKVVENSHGIRRHGSAATDLAYVAAGRFDGFFEYGLSVWDVAAGAFLVQQAGGVVADYSGGDNYLYGREILAGTKGVYSELLKIIHQNM